MGSWTISWYMYFYTCPNVYIETHLEYLFSWNLCSHKIKKSLFSIWACYITCIVMLKLCIVEFNKPLSNFNRLLTYHIFTIQSNRTHSTCKCLLGQVNCYESVQTFGFLKWMIVISIISSLIDRLCLLSIKFSYQYHNDELSSPNNE